jgi:predicted metal-dependent hydrolase
MSNSRGPDAIHVRQLRAFAENLYTLGNRHHENENYVVAHALYGRALEAAQRIDDPEHNENGTALVTRIQKDRQAVYEFLRHGDGSPEKARLEKAKKVGR